MKHKKLACGVTAALCLSMLGQLPVLPVSADNPIIQTSFTPDPAPVVFGDELYVYTGCDKDGNNGNYTMTGWQCFSTKDMKNWTDHGRVMEDTDFSWGNENDAWASQCIERNGKYYLYVTSTDSQGRGRAIGVAVADSPEGPFKDPLGKPLCGPNWWYIDPTVMIDDNGQAWLFFGNPTLYYVKLNEDMISTDGEVKQFDMNTAAFGPGDGKDRKSAYGEGPWIYKHGDLYYMVYASFYNGEGGESMCYSTGPSITGPWTFRGQIMKMHNCFTTHGGIIDFKGHSYLFYHKNGLKGGGTFNRSACVEEFTFNPDGSIPLISPTNAGPDQLETVNPYERVEAETMSWSEGIKTEPSADGKTMAIGFIENGDYIKVSGVDFGDDGASTFFASVSSNGQGGTIEVHLDDVTGPIVSTATVPVTGDWKKYVTVESEVTGAKGTHDLYLRFSGGDSYLFNVDWWQFSKQSSTSFRLADCDGDGKVNAADFTIAKRGAMSGFKDIAAEKAADVDQSGTVDLTDIQWYVSFLTGETDALPEKYTPPTPPPSAFNYNSAVTFREAPGEYFEDKATQKGTVVKEDYNGINGNKTLYVYLPYGYDTNKKYNIFYLMHGGGENETTCFQDKWTHINYMLDRMIENGEIDPMIVVTPTFNKCASADDVNAEMRQSIIPFVEAKYSTYAENTTLDGLKASRFHRAYGGFSMGGGTTWSNFIMNLDIIAYFMPLSGHSWAGLGPIDKAIDNLGMTPRDYFIFAATGTEDQAYGNMNPLINSMKNDSRFVYTSDFSKGNLYYLVANGRTHWWGNVRHYIYDALPYFFHEGV